jgi:hypothetical protein
MSDRTDEAETVVSRCNLSWSAMVENKQLPSFCGSSLIKQCVNGWDSTSFAFGLLTAKE